MESSIALAFILFITWITALYLYSAIRYLIYKISTSIRSMGNDIKRVFRLESTENL